MNGEQTLKHLADVCRQHGLNVWQWKPGPVGQHAANSYHSLTFPDGIGQAFDAFGPKKNMRECARYIATHYGDVVSEAIHNPGIFRSWQKWSLSRKHGQHVPPIRFWGIWEWLKHRDHIHIARGPEV